MTKSDLAGTVLQSLLAACFAIACTTTGSAAPTAVTELPQALWGKECFGPSPSKTYPGMMWYVLLRVANDGKKAETWSGYGLPGSRTTQSVVDEGFKREATLFTSWGDNTYTVPVLSSRGTTWSIFIKLLDNKVQFTNNIVVGTADCKSLK